MGSGITLLVTVLLVNSVLAPPPPQDRPADDSNPSLNTNKVRKADSKMTD